MVNLVYELSRKNTRRALHRNLNPPLKRNRATNQDNSDNHDDNLSVDLAQSLEDLRLLAPANSKYSDSIADHDHCTKDTNRETCLNCSYKAEVITSLS